LGDERGVLDESVHGIHRNSQGLSVTESVGGTGLQRVIHRRTGEQFTNFAITGGLQIRIAPVAVSELAGTVGKLGGHRKLVTKADVLTLELSTAKTVAVKYGGRCRRRACTTSSTRRADNVGRRGD
jgi:hypothetical protein